jgi:hypothetical protein
MRVTTEIGNRHEFVLKQALLVYEDQVSRREQFVTVHEILREGAEPQQPRLGPGTLLTTSFLKQLCRGLERRTKANIGRAGVVDSAKAAPHVLLGWS